ncbi:MAG TPA: VWA domain-containing protein [Thermoanaerobaculia bacterium]|nr:VWA domain-containing protein [Thermoanaerobaculia bacterium]
MKRAFRTMLLLAAVASAASAADEPKGLTITLDPLGDSDAGVVARVTYHFVIPDDVPDGVPLVIVGSITQGQQVTKRFRYPLSPKQRDKLTSIQTFQPGDAEIDARLMVPLQEDEPVIVAKEVTHFTIARTGKPYVASELEGAESIMAEGSVPVTAGAVHILTPRRDVAPNLFIVDVEAKPPVKHVEFWVDGKKVMTRNQPPYHAELDLGLLPKRVEVRAVGYDDHNRYVDADAFVVNERQTPLEVKITRTDTPDKIAHIRLSIQNPKSTDIRSVKLFADQKQFCEWPQPPYAIDVPISRLANIRFLRASVVDSTNYEASDLLFLNGGQINEQVDVNLIELPVAVTDAAGAPITGMTRGDFHIAEDGKPQTITNFDAASNLPIAVGLLVDHSGSMKPRMAETKKAAAEFLSRILQPRDRAFVAGFAFDPAKLAPFVNDLGALEEQIDSIPEANGGTSLYDAIITGLYRFRSLQGRRALVILTDGEDTTSRISYDEMLTYAREARVPLYFIGIGLGFGDLVGVNKMKALAAETGGVAYLIRDVKKLDATYAELEKDLRSQYLVAYSSESTKGDEKYRTVQVTVDRPGAHVRTIRGFLP